ncbi:MAG TPA: VOC family protein [Bacteroidia bacterium]|nr:VOC family protein [Bacteroidia bacterium]
MQKLQLPPNYQTVMPYLILKGAKQFLQFAKSIFAAEEVAVYPTPEGDGIMHGEIKIGDSLIMFADSNEEYPSSTSGLYIHVASVDETYRKALAEGATSKIAPVKKDYGYTAGFSDPFGNIWWLVEAEVG